MINYKNRGKLFEKIIYKSLLKIDKDNNGIFFKSPTIIKPIEIKYLSGSPLITKAIFESKALCDFYGIYKNKFVLIEAKEIKTTSFSLTNIKEHQINQLNKIKEYGGISFIIFNFVKYNMYICLDINKFNKLSLNKKSLKFIELKKEGFILTFFNMKLNINEYLDYLFDNQL